MNGGESILVVESDPDVSDLICRQALGPMGCHPRLVPTAAAALEQARRSPPDLIVSNLDLPDLSGKDLLTALSSLGGTAPLVVVAEKGQEQRVIQAFRLGAADALFLPAPDRAVLAAGAVEAYHAMQGVTGDDAGQSTAGALEVICFAIEK